MNWIALDQSPHWRALWKSEEITKMTETVRNQILHGKFDPESRGRLVGRLQILEDLPRFVERLANKQREDESTPNEREQEASVTSFFRRL